VATLRAANVADFDAALLKLAGAKDRDVDLRLSAFAAAAPRVKTVDADLFAFVVGQLDKERPPLLRLSAANALGQTRLDSEQLVRLTQAVAIAGPLELPPLLAAFEKPVPAEVGRKLIDALEKTPAFSSLSATALDRLFKNQPEEVRQAAVKLTKRLEADALTQRERLTELEPLLTGGDVGRGRLVFFGVKAACSACHTVEKAGGNIGPDLSKIGAVRSGRDLLEAVIFPSASFARGYEPYVVETRGGQVVTGILARETPADLTLVTAERAEVRIPRTQIESLVPGRVSIMPQGLETQISRDELRDLLAYLQSLR
jgi:putative heme-binding domain-containing protein